MCLNKITKVYKPSLFNLWIPRFAYKSGVGWKYLHVRENDSLSTSHQGNDATLIKNEFLDEKNYRHITHRNDEIIIMLNIAYSFGWHILLERPNPGPHHVFTLRKVEYKEGHTIGTDQNYKGTTIVARYMKILP